MLLCAGDASSLVRIRSSFASISLASDGRDAVQPIVVVCGGCLGGAERAEPAE